MKTYQKLVRILKTKLPCAYPVRINRLKMTSKSDGDCQLKGKSFAIRINKNLTEKEAMDTLLHEYAHARAWSHLHSALDPAEFMKICHDASWGVAYAECFRIFEEYMT